MAVRYQGIELPKLTMHLSELSDAIEAAQGNRERYQAMWDFMTEALGDALPETVDGETLETCDLVSLAVAYTGVIDAYATPIMEEQRRQVREQVSAVQPAIDAMGKLSRGQSRQGFRNVK